MELQQIGLSHPRVKQVLDIQNNTASNRERLLVAEGLWAQRLVLSAGVGVRTFLWCPELAYSDEARLRASQLVERAENAYQVSARTLERIGERGQPDGLLSVVRLPWYEPDVLDFGPSALVLVADAVEIPGNLGTLIRTLDAVGADALVLTNRRTRLTHPKVFRGSQGTVLTVPSVEFDVAGPAVDWLRSRRFRVLLADTDDARPYRETDYSGRVALVVGSERYGISKPWYEHGFDRVAVPMLGAADSLNVSVSASVLLYEARARQSGW
ncbi:MAG TPA: TrmH family RNA methyltransferase [Mycobacteriales bacterium]|nr:TrmH family RNA methyltransferase [Mycobacteriales bacterium]